MKNTGVQFEISVRVPRSYRDRLDYATEAAEFLTCESQR